MPELKEGIKLFWQMMTPKVCSKYIDHLQKVMPDVIKVDGAPSGHKLYSFLLLINFSLIIILLFLCIL